MQVEFMWEALLWFFPIVFIHELGHAVAGWALGNRGAVIRFGDPKARWRTVLPLGPLRVEWNWGLGLWLTVALCRFEHWPSRSPGRKLLFALGGPLASALFLLLVWPHSAAEVVWWPQPGMTGRQLVQFLALWFTATPLIPLRTPSGLPSDGLQIIRHTRDLLRRRQRPA